MPQLLPFPGLRPNAAIVGEISTFVCPPYDVITDEQRAELLTRSPYNVVRVELPNGEYQRAAQLLSEWRVAGALSREASPALYGYRMTYPTPGGGVRSTTGVMGALVLEPPGHGILPHEQTTPKAKTDRLELIRVTKANTSPIWCLCTAPGLTEALGGPPSEGAGTAQAVDDDGNLHEIWALTEPGVHTKVDAAVGGAPLLIADGHHRYETALAYQAEQPPGPLGPDAVLALVVELNEDSLEVRAIHRLLSALPATAGILDAFERSFDLLPTSADGSQLLAEMLACGAIGVVSREGTWLGRPRPGSDSATFELDSSRVDAALSTLPPHVLGYEHDVARAVGEVRAGRADAAVLCRPATVAQIAATARGGSRMPPKTTFFWPKPRTGMVLRAWGS